MAILSIQSHVSYGYVGNKAAVFPLQRLGMEVWDVDTVEFSNHTGYGAWRGKVLGAEHVREIIRGIGERGVLGRCGAVLSGYLGDADIAEAVGESVERVRAANGRALYCCDPVMGDEGRGVFVKGGIPAVLKERLIPLADIATPNAFELSLLTGIDLEGGRNTVEAVRALHAMGPRVVLVTSFRPEHADREYISMLVSDRGTMHRVETPELPLDPSPNGAGDLTAALFLARYLQTADAARALELTADSVFSVFEATVRAGTRELALIDAQDAIAAPSRRFPASRL
jgi:pyridoxine kinase